jgi:hypothetical protein
VNLTLLFSRVDVDDCLKGAARARRRTAPRDRPLLRIDQRASVFVMPVAHGNADQSWYRCKTLIAAKGAEGKSATQSFDDAKCIDSINRRHFKAPRQSASL